MVYTYWSGLGRREVLSLLNALDADLALRTGGISEATQKGKHTTTYAELIPISEMHPNAGFIGDTPGLREFGLVEIEAPTSLIASSNSAKTWVSVGFPTARTIMSLDAISRSWSTRT